MDEGLEFRPKFDYRTEFDTMALFRMDPLTRAEAAAKAIAGRYLSPNEARAAEDMPPVTGGDEPFAQLVVQDNKKVIGAWFSW